MKTCTRCGNTKPATTEHFHKHERSLRSYCKDCYNAYKRSYDKETKELKSRRWKQYYKDNQDILRSKSNAYQRVYRPNRGRGVLAEGADPSEITKFYLLSRWLSRKTGIAHEVDHIVPLAVGGKHHQDNLQVITATANRAKHCSIDESVVGIRLDEVELALSKCS